MIAIGHAGAWNYTPRELVGWMHFVQARRKREAAEALSIGAMAAQGDAKSIKKALKDWSKP